jgi:toxin FitB
MKKTRRDGETARAAPPGDRRAIAATARVHGLTVVTRNVKDFELAGVQVLNPFVE